MAIAIGSASDLFAARTGGTIAIGLIAAAMFLLLLVVLRELPAVANIGPFYNLGVGSLAASVLLITFNGVRVGAHVTVSDLLLLGTAIIFLLSLLGDRSVVPRPPGWLLFGAIGLLATGFLSTWTTIDIGGDVVATVEFAMALLGVPLLLAFATGASDRLLLFARLWLVSATINSAVAVTDFAHVTSIGLTLSGRPSGLTVHPNHLGMVAAMAIPLALFLAARARKWPSAAVYLGTVGILTLGVLVSGSRAALLAAMAGALLLPALGNRLLKPVVLIAIAAGGLLLFTSGVLTTNQPSTTSPFVAIERLADPATASSDTGRLEYYSAALADFARRPFTGIGFDLVRTAHDIYFQLLQAGGILALASFLVFSAGSLRLGMKLTRDQALSRDMQNLAAALTASLLVWLVAGLVQNLIYDRFLYLPVGLLVGLNSVARWKRRC